MNGSGVLTQPLLAGWLRPGWLSESESYLIEQLSTNFLLSPEKERDEYKCTIKNIEQKKMSRFRMETLRALVSTESSMDTWTGKLKMTW